MSSLWWPLHFHCSRCVHRSDISHIPQWKPEDRHVYFYSRLCRVCWKKIKQNSKLTCGEQYWLTMHTILNYICKPLYVYKKKCFQVTSPVRFNIRGKVFLLLLEVLCTFDHGFDGSVPLSGYQFKQQQGWVNGVSQLGCKWRLHVLSICPQICCERLADVKDPKPQAHERPWCYQMLRFWMSDMQPASLSEMQLWYTIHTFYLFHYLDFSY